MTSSPASSFARQVLWCFGDLVRWCFGSLVVLIKPALSPLIPQRYGVIKESYA